jgi:hypothetical protein
MSRAALLSYVMIWSWLPHTDARLNDLLGNQVHLESRGGDKTEDGMYRFSCFVNDSLKELSRTDFEGTPKILDRNQQYFVVGALRNYLDHVGEVYSPPRVTKEACLQGLKGQIALDLTTGWDFRIPEHRKKALALIAKKRPAVLLLSLPCTTFSPLRRLTNRKRDSRQVRQEEVEGEQRMDFNVSLAELQMREGRGFILEQPAPATSWQRPIVRTLVENPEVHLVRADMCQFGLRAQCGPHQGELVQKPTILATNIDEIAAHAQKVCQKNHHHGQLIGGAAKYAAVYTPAFVKAVVGGIKEALGIKACLQHPNHLQQAFAFGKNLGSQAHVFAQDCL